MLVYSRQVDPKKLVLLDLTTSLTELSTYVNTTKIPPEDVAPREIEYRSLSQTPRFTLARKFGRCENNVSLTYSAMFGGYYVVLQSVVAHSATLSSGNNNGETLKPVVHVMARVMAGDVSYSNLINRVTIGYSTDGGTTWTPLSNVSRPLAWSGGKVRRVFNNIPQAHFWTGINVYVPFNAPMDRPITVVASFGGSISNGNPLGITHYAVMVNNTNDAKLLAGVLFLTARDNGM